jgi:hypothetical protein
MASSSHTLYTTLEWDWARRVAGGSIKLSEILKTYPEKGDESYAPVIPGPYYVLDEKPMVPDSASETLLAVRFPESVDLDSFEEPLGCDAPMTWFHLPKHVLDLGQPEFVPYGILAVLAKADLPYPPDWTCNSSMEDMIRRTPKHERPSQFGHYHLMAFEAEYGDEEEEVEE